MLMRRILEGKYSKIVCIPQITGCVLDTTEIQNEIPQRVMHTVS